MSKAIVRCRCGHQILAKEVLRTDLYERSSGRDCVYIKFRCARCKRMGQSFIAESRWDWSILEAERNEMSSKERDHFLDESPISAVELLNFHSQLRDVSSLVDLQKLAPQLKTEPPKSESRDARDLKDLRLRPHKDRNGERSNERNAGERNPGDDALQGGSADNSDDASTK